MNYSLIRLRFDGLAHFGTSDSALSLFTSEDHFYADTLFSALCHTALSLHGIDGLHSLLQQAADGSLLLSDSMPWHRTAHGVDYYLPKPCRTFSRLPQKQDMPQGSRKAMKKLAWIPVRSFSDFWRSIAGEASYQPQPGHLQAECRPPCPTKRMPFPIRWAHIASFPIAVCMC